MHEGEPSTHIQCSSARWLKKWLQSTSRWRIWVLHAPAQPAVSTYACVSCPYPALVRCEVVVNTVYSPDMAPNGTVVTWWVPECPYSQNEFFVVKNWSTVKEIFALLIVLCHYVYSWSATVHAINHCTSCLQLIIICKKVSLTWKVYCWPHMLLKRLPVHLVGPDFMWPAINNTKYHHTYFHLLGYASCIFPRHQTFPGLQE